MKPLLPLNDGEFSLIVRHSIDSEEEMIEAVVDAFLAAGVDVYERPTTLGEETGSDIFELQWSSGRPLYLCTQIWDHLVVMTPEEVRIYVSSGDICCPTTLPSGQQTSSNGSATRDSAIIESNR